MVAIMRNMSSMKALAAPALAVAFVFAPAPLWNPEFSCLTLQTSDCVDVVPVISGGSGAANSGGSSGTSPVAPTDSQPPNGGN